MAKARSSNLLHQVRTLFGAGTVTGLSDAQLLERFTSRSARQPKMPWPLRQPSRRWSLVTGRWFWGYAAAR
jgi:hypothetical protein